MKKKYRILAIADAAFASTGYGNQSEVLLSRLAQRGWDVYQLACNCYDIHQCEKGEKGPLYHGINIIKNTEHEQKGIDGLYNSKEGIWEIYNNLKPDIIWTLNDFYRVGGLAEFSQDFLDRWVHWMPIDNHYSETSWIDFMNRMRYMVFLSYFGWNQVAKYLPHIPYKDAIYHGVPSDVFKPLWSKSELKSALQVKDKFVVTTVGRHQPRKIIWKTANVMARFMKSHPDVIWFCKTDPNDAAMANYPECEKNLTHILDREGVLNRTYFETQYLCPEKLNEFYNAGDIFMHLSGGEGFGIPYVESMLAEVPCILTNNTTSPELTGYGEFGLLVDAKETIFLKQFNSTYDLADEEDALRKLEFAYTDWKSGGSWLRTAGIKGREFHKNWCDAEKVTDRWEEVFYRIIRYNNKICWRSSFSRGVGYSITSETIIPELEKLGYDIYIKDLTIPESPVLSQHMRELKEKTSKTNVNLDECINADFYLQETFVDVPGNKKIGWGFAESTKLNPKYKNFCNCMETIVTTSEFSKRAMRNSGVTTDIRIISPWVDTNAYPLLERPDDRKNFTFLHIGVAQERKNTFQLIEAYMKAFPDQERSRTKLLIKSNDFGKLDIFNAVVEDRKDIELIYTNEKPLSHEQILELYKVADCYINVSHGEGIGNPEMEALSTGLPVISSNWDGRNVFLDEEVGWMLKISSVGKAFPETKPDIDFGEWANFDGEAMVSLLQYVASHPEECKEKGRKGAQRMRERFTPDRAALQLDDIFMDFYTLNSENVPKERCYGRIVGEPHITNEPKTKVSFDENYFTNIHKYNPDTFHRVVADNIIKLTYGLTGNIIDIGCGTGYLMKHFLDRGKNVVGIDISDWAVEHPLSGCEGRIFKGSVLDIPYDDNTFDFAIAFSLLEHIPESDVEKALREIRRVAKRAFVEIAMITPGWTRERLESEDPTHINIKDFPWWEKKINEAGMKVVWYDNCMSMILEHSE